MFSPYMLPQFIPIFGPSMGALALLNHIAGDHRNLALEVTRSLPNNVTTEMDLALWKTAIAIRSDAESASVFRGTDAQALAQQYLSGGLPRLRRLLSRSLWRNMACAAQARSISDSRAGAKTPHP